MAPACADTDVCNCHLADARLLTRGAIVLCGGGFTDREWIPTTLLANREHRRY